MKELSLFIDESGDFGKYNPISPYYLICIVFHDQSNNISKEIKNFENSLENAGFSKDFYVHVGPAIRRENSFSKMDVQGRRSLVQKLTVFARKIEFMYQAFELDKKHLNSSNEIIRNFKRQIDNFITENLAFFVKYDTIKIYYDRGQREISKILRETFIKRLTNAHMKKGISPVNYKLLQVTDLVCTLELTKRKMRGEGLSKSEKTFFGQKYRNIEKNYFNPVLKKKHVIVHKKCPVFSI